MADSVMCVKLSQKDYLLRMFSVFFFNSKRAVLEPLYNIIFVYLPQHNIAYFQKKPKNLDKIENGFRIFPN